MSQGRSWLRILNRQRIFIGIVILFLVLTFTTRSFFNYKNLINILYQISVDGVLATGMTILMLMGEIDLSIGMNMALVGTVIVMLQPLGILLSIAGGVLTGVLVGFLNGFLVTRLRLNSLPATLGMMIGLQGLVLLLTNSQTVKGSNARFIDWGNSELLTIPYAVFFYAAILLLFILIMGRSYFGRNVYAIGGNATASLFFGINVDRIRMTAFLVMGLLVGVASVLTTARLNIASAIIGRDTPLFAITAVLLGGTNLLGGVGGVFNTFQGILLLGIIANGMIMIQVPPAWQIVVKGALLILIVSVDGYYLKHARYR